MNKRNNRLGGGRVKQYTQSGLTVPYMAMWSAEKYCHPTLETRFGREGPFLGYVDEYDYDRDCGGALWTRCSLAQGKGQAKFKAVHPLRQRNAMLRSLCQICGTCVLATEHEQLLHLAGGAGCPVTEGEPTSAPPVCRSCAPKAVQECPHLKRGCTATWVDHFKAWGVTGTVYDLDTLQPVAGLETVDVHYLDPLIRQVVAHRLVNSLHGCRPADLRTMRPRM